MKGLAKAVELVGGTAALARKIGVHPNVVSNWKTRRVPAEHCPKIELLTDRQVRCEDLNDLVDWAALRVPAVAA